jgi:hypothetical protein
MRRGARVNAHRGGRKRPAREARPCATEHEGTFVECNRPDPAQAQAEILSDAAA